MSEELPPPGISPGTPPGTPPGSGDARSASVTLRAPTEADGDQQLLDRANRSALAALNTAYTLLGIIMLGLVVLFVFSGVQTVGESERGVRLRFGAIVDRDLPPGVHLALPAPFGELKTVAVGQSQLDLREAFFPALRETQRNQTIEQIAASSYKDSYNPSSDGQLITADRNLAHVRVSVSYRKSDPSLYIANVGLPESERRLIEKMVERAVVRAAAEVGIDDVVRMTPGSEGSIASRARAIAQQGLDEASTGIEITRLDLNDPGPPLSLYRDFAAVTSATAKFNEERAKAEQDARARLNALAGAAAEPLVELISRYERATDLADAQAQAGLLEAIDAVLLGRAVTVSPEVDGLDGAETLVVAQGQISGEVTRVLSEAETASRSARDEARADLAVFRAKLDQYRRNPGLVIRSEWARAFGAFITKETVQAMFVPEGTDFVDLELNRDPVIAREQERARNEIELRKASDERARLIDQERTQLRQEGASVE